jgi:hypothetical protein
MHPHFRFLVPVLASLALVACGHPKQTDMTLAEGSTFSVPGRAAGSAGATGATPSADMAGSGTSGSSSTTGTGTVAAGVLTAGIWDDNDNFARFTTFRDGVTAPSKPPFTAAEQQAASALAAQGRGPKTSLDVVLVIDTTGSMGDEITYLQAEFIAISSQVAAQFPNVPQRWGLVAYKDYNDPYIVQGADFGTSITWFQSQLALLSASGGGDYEEVPDQGLATAAGLSWNPSPDTARLVFHVADAPHHPDKAQAYADAVRSLRDVGAHIYPVASSGVDELTEYSMRAAAQLTTGRYLFLTDDSGVGGAHLEPTIPCYQVTHLNQAMLRAIESELSGTHVAADPTTVIRSVGNPSNGACTLADGSPASAF